MLRAEVTSEVLRPSALASAVCLLGLVTCPALHSQSKPLLRITSPADGTVVHPGDTIQVAVALDPSVKARYAGVIPHLPLESGAGAESPPYRFTVKVPWTIAEAGEYGVTAAAATGARLPLFSRTIKLDVEPASRITHLRVSPTGISFDRKGERIPLEVTGSFADGSTLDITRSTRIRYKSSDTSVITVSPAGIVTAVGTGCGGCYGIGMIDVFFGDQTAILQISTHGLAKPPRRR